MINQDKLWWRFLIKTILFIGIAAIVQTFWVSLEVAIYGVEQPRVVDTIVGLVLSTSLYCNLRHRTKIGGK